MLYKKGELYVSRCGHTLMLFFPENDVFEGYESYEQKSVAQKRGNIAGSLFADFTDNAQPGGETLMGVPIEVRKATDEDIIEIIRNWNDRGNIPIEYWLTVIPIEGRGLLQHEIERIQRIYHELQVTV